jgi:hypothetical protein
MLSPKATNRVAEICGTGGLGGAALTCTSNSHDAVRCFPSSALHLTIVDPTAALLPFPGEHDELTGAVPPVIVGGAYEIATGLPSGDVSS